MMYFNMSIMVYGFVFDKCGEKIIVVGLSVVVIYDMSMG